MPDEAPRTFKLGTPRETAAPKAESPNSGRRAKPPTSQRPAAPKQDVDRAVAMMDTLYELMGDGMDLFGLEDTRIKWNGAVAKLRRTNRDSLSASPKLARSIANVGENGGATTFFLAHVVAVATLYPVAAREMRANLEANGPRHAAPEQGVPNWDDFPPATPDPGGYNVGEYIPGL